MTGSCWEAKSLCNYIGGFHSSPPRSAYCERLADSDMDDAIPILEQFLIISTSEIASQFLHNIPILLLKGLL